MLIQRKSQDIDKAIEYLSAKDGDNVDISPALRDFVDRMVRFQALVLRHSKSRALALYCRIFDISKSQAYRDYSKMEIIFGSAKKTNKDFMRELSIIKLERIESTALEQGDLRTALGARSKIFEWSTKEDIQPPFDPNEIERPVIVVGQFPEKFKNSKMPKDPAEREKIIRDLKINHKLGEMADEIDFDETDDS